MGRPKGSKNKKQIVCAPPEDRFEPPPSDKGEVFDAVVKVLRGAGTSHDGTYIVGTMKNGKLYIGKLGWSDCVPQTKELMKKLGVE